jgi:ribonuclease G
MSKELIVSSGRHETRVAILEEDQLVEIFHERSKEYSLAGSIHKGRVTRVLPGMQSAFVDIGLERDAFLYVSDFFEDNEEYDAVVSTVEEKVLKMDREKTDRSDRGSERTEPGSERGERGSERTERSSERGDRGSERTERSSERRGRERGERERPERERHEREREEIAAAPVNSAPEAVLEAESAAPVAEQVHAEETPTGQPRPEQARPEGARPERGERGGDRGDRGDRRGRRGRRRRSGNRSSLPESKFASPRGEEPAPAPPMNSPEIDEEFMVLPGESLAKYAVADVRVEDQDDSFENAPGEDEGGYGAHAEPAVARAKPEEPGGGIAATTVAAKASEPEAGPPVEAPLPSEHPLAGLGAISTWISEPAPASNGRENAPPVSENATHTEEAAEEDLSAEGSEPEELAEESEQIEPAEPDIAAEGESEEETGDESASAEGEESPIAEEGPEPARIPTSLTATLREQGHRYPHRVSRRMRRKMRPGDENTATAAGEERQPQVAEERRGEQPKRHERGERPERERSDRERPVLPSIADLLKEGQEIIVQIAKEPLGQKGARITSHIALPGRFVVYMPTVDHVGVSRKIPSDEERQRLKRVLQTHRQGIPGGFICRTAAEGRTEEELSADMHFLYNLWLDLRQKAEKKPAPALLHHDLDLVQRILRDQLTSNFKTIWVDSEDLYESMLRFVQRFQPALVSRVKLYTRSAPIFDEFGITGEIEKALRPKVWLKSGGYIVINQTEALVAIDINTGKYVGKSNRLEDTIVKINTDAIKEIVRQIRLRDLGGIIVVDFIDMDERKNRQKVMQSLEESMRADRAPYKILQFNDFGLVAITRKRVKQSLERTLCSPCPYCEGAGYVKSVSTVISEIMQEAQRTRKALENERDVVLRVNPEVAKLLKSNQNSFLQEIEETLGRNVLVKNDPLLHQTKFDLA